MKLRRLLVIPIGIVILGALVSTASAGRLSNSTTTLNGTFTRVDFSGGFGIIECELTVMGALVRSTAKVLGRAIGAITAANVPACRRGSATVLRETLPWTLAYRSFIGTLPNIGWTVTLVGAKLRAREATFGVTCVASSTTESPAILTTNREAGGRVASLDISGSIPCQGAINVTGGLSGRSSSVSALTITLI